MLLELIATPAAYLACSPFVHLLLMTRHQKKVAVVIILAGLLLLGIGWIVWRMFTRGWRETDEFDTPDLEAKPFGLGDSLPPVDRPDNPPDEQPIDEAVAKLMAPAPPREDETRSAGELYNAALRLVTEMGGVSIPAIQRRLDIDFERAGEMVAQMEKDGFLVPGGAAGAKQKVTPEAYAYIERLDES